MLRITNRDWKFEECGKSNFDRIIQGCALAMQQSRSPLRVEQMGPSGFQPEACWRVVSRRVGELVQIQQTRLSVVFCCDRETRLRIYVVMKQRSMFGARTTDRTRLYDL